MTLADLVAEWDRQCVLRSRRRASDLPTVEVTNRLADALAVEAEALGVTSVVLRRQVAAAKRDALQIPDGTVRRRGETG